MAKGKLIIISAPSGCGKSTIIGEIIKNEGLNLAFSISATTRAPRGEEIDGVNYYFLSEDEFKQAISIIVQDVFPIGGGKSPHKPASEENSFFKGLFKKR